MSSLEFYTPEWIIFTFWTLVLSIAVAIHCHFKLKASPLSKILKEDIKRLRSSKTVFIKYAPAVSMAIVIVILFLVCIFGLISFAAYNISVSIAFLSVAYFPEITKFLSPPSRNNHQAEH